MVVQRASIRALGDGREPNLDITASLSKVATNDAELDDLAIALHSDAFNIKNRSGPVTGTATAAALIIDNPTIAPLVAGKISAGHCRHAYHGLARPSPTAISAATRCPANSPATCRWSTVR